MRMDIGSGRGPQVVGLEAPSTGSLSGEQTERLSEGERDLRVELPLCMYCKPPSLCLCLTLSLCHFVY